MSTPGTKLALFDMRPVVQRLRQSYAPEIAIAGASEAAEALESPSPRPNCVYVITAREQGGPLEGYSGGVYVQPVDCRFSVLISARNYRVSERGTAQQPHIGELVLQTRTALINWAPASKGDGLVRFVAGRVLRFSKQLLWWEETYAVASQLKTSRQS